MSPQRALALLATGLLLACPGPKPKEDVSSDSGDGAGSSRSYLMGGEALTYHVSGPTRWSITEAHLQREAESESTVEADAGTPETVTEWLTEAIVLPVHLYGIPWSKFSATEDTPENLPGAWVSALYELKEKADGWGRKVILGLMPTNSRYDNLAPKADDDGAGGLALKENWLNEYCPNPAAGGNPTKWPTAYARYVSWIVQVFDPEFVILGRRMNLYEENCGEVNPGSYEALVGFATAAHERLKADGGGPTTIVSLDVEDLYGYPRTPGRCSSMTPKECFEERKSLLGPIVADRLGLATFPATALGSLQDLPSDWVSHIADAQASLPVVITGAGLPSTRLEKAAGVCIPLVETDTTLQRTFLDQLLDDAADRDMELVVWTSLRDFYSAETVGACSCAGEKTLCDHLAQLGESADTLRPQLIQGLFDVEGTEREAGVLWRDLLQQ